MRTNIPNPKAAKIRSIIHKQNMSSFTEYHKLLNAGCPREIARSVLPVGTYSHMFATANLHNFLKFIGERVHQNAQYEIRVYAIALLKLLYSIVQITMDAFITGLDANGEVLQVQRDFRNRY